MRSHRIEPVIRCQKRYSAIFISGKRLLYTVVIYVYFSVIKRRVIIFECKYVWIRNIKRYRCVLRFVCFGSKLFFRIVVYYLFFCFVYVIYVFRILNCPFGYGNLRILAKSFALDSRSLSAVECSSRNILYIRSVRSGIDATVFFVISAERNTCAGSVFNRIRFPYAAIA